MTVIPQEAVPDKPAGAGPSAQDGEPILPVRSLDDTDVGWGERAEAGDDDERFRRDRPPHWDSA